MTCQEGKALCLGAEQTGCQFTVADTYLAVVSNRARNAEALQTFADVVGCLYGILCLFLQSDSGTYHVSPLSVLEANHLCLFASLVGVKACSLANLVGLLDRSNTMFVQASKNLLDSTVL